MSRNSICEHDYADIDQACPVCWGEDNPAALGEVIFAYGNNDDTRDEMFDWVRKDVAEADIARLRAALEEIEDKLEAASHHRNYRQAAIDIHEIARAALSPSEPKAPNRPNPSKAEEKGCESWDPWKHA
jgi:hypothetical protein